MNAMPEKNGQNFDIFNLLEAETNSKKKRREELLASVGVKSFFVDGKISIDKRTCWGLECKLCIKACPTNALYWDRGEVKIVNDLCVYCGACVLSCMVDDCIRVSRVRESGEKESFSKPKEVVVLQNCINAKKRAARVRTILPSIEAYFKRYEPEKP
jgi:ferredoxin